MEVFWIDEYLVLRVSSTDEILERFRKGIIYMFFPSITTIYDFITTENNFFSTLTKQKKHS